MLGFKGLNGHPWDQKRPPINRGVCTLADPGEGPGGPGGPPPLFLDQTEARRAEKIFWGAPGPPYLRVWMTAPAFYLKVWIC